GRIHQRVHPLAGSPGLGRGPNASRRRDPSVLPRRLFLGPTRWRVKGTGEPPARRARRRSFSEWFGASSWKSSGAYFHSPPHSKMQGEHLVIEFVSGESERELRVGGFAVEPAAVTDRERFVSDAVALDSPLETNERKGLLR